MKQKLLALLLALALSLSFTTVFAAEETDSAPPSEVETLTEEPVTEPETEKVDLKKQIVPESEVPDLIDYDIAVEEKYVCRAYWKRAGHCVMDNDGNNDVPRWDFPVNQQEPLVAKHLMKLLN